MGSILVLVAGLGALGLFLSLAYLAEREPGLRWLVYLILGLADLVMIPIGLLLIAASWLATLDPATSTEMMGLLGEVGLQPDSALSLVSQLGLIVVGMGVAGLLLLLPPIRRLVALALPVEPDRVVHTVALQYVVYLVGASLLTLVTITTFVGDEEALEQLSNMSAEGGLATLWAQSIGFVLLSVLGVGIAVKRNPRETLARLGLTWSFSVKWWLAATALALIASYGIDILWGWLASENLAEVEQLSEALFPPYLSAGLVGALTIGLSAGIGEEILFRGAAQPRLGLVFTSLLFGVMHTQYTVSLALFQVFLVGLLLGLTRRHTNTTTAIGVHATFNFVLASMAIYGG